jgi:hypothetical protein
MYQSKGVAEVRFGDVSNERAYGRHVMSMYESKGVGSGCSSGKRRVAAFEGGSETVLLPAQSFGQGRAGSCRMIAGNSYFINN